MSSPEDHVLLDGVHLVLVIRPSRVHVLYHGANVADNGRDNQNPCMVCFMVKIWSKRSFTDEKINCDKEILVILNRLRSFSKGGHGEH